MVVMVAISPSEDWRFMGLSLDLVSSSKQHKEHKSSVSQCSQSVLFIFKEQEANDERGVDFSKMSYS